MGNWVLYEIYRRKRKTKLKVGIGNADNTLADGLTNSRASTSERKARDDYSDATHEVILRCDGITKGDMKKIEAERVRNYKILRKKLRLNRENDSNYKVKAGQKCDCTEINKHMESGKCHLV